MWRLGFQSTPLCRLEAESQEILLSDEKIMRHRKGQITHEENERGNLLGEQKILSLGKNLIYKK